MTDCGGHLEQPICLYDFTVKTLSHTCLNFATRHMSHGNKSNFIDSTYITAAKTQSFGRRNTNMHSFNRSTAVAENEESKDLMPTVQ